MKRILIFGTGSTGRRIYDEVKDNADVVGFLDNNAEMWGEYIDGVPIIGNAGALKDIEYDEILVCSLPGMTAIRNQLCEAGVLWSKINCEYISTQVNARINFLRDYSEMCADIPNDICVAECGVFQGDFAKEINSGFPDKRLFLFDTFEGFDERDTEKEHKDNLSIFGKGHLGNTSVSLVLSKMPYPEKVEIRKGYFPETAVGLENISFAFVNLDFDLYNPTLEGLRFFFPRIISDGIILIHDYYNPGYKGIKQAIDDFEKESGIRLKRFPIGDHCSIAILK